MGTHPGNTKGKKFCSMETYRKMILNHIENESFNSTFEAINKQHNEIYGFDFEPKF